MLNAGIQIALFATVLYAIGLVFAFKENNLTTPDIEHKSEEQDD
jgi:phosphotransferase system  glucose/maltose/N-acetylglucosamine-specific IIC component